MRKKLKMMLTSIIIGIVGITVFTIAESSAASVLRVIGAGLIIRWTIEMSYFTSVLSNETNKDQLFGLYMIHTFFLSVGTACGIIFLFEPNIFDPFLTLTIGMTVMFESVLTAVFMLSLKKMNEKTWKATMIQVLIILAAGIVIIINPFESVSVIIRIAGAVFFFDSIWSLILTKKA